jgi:hypothetical protein
VKPGRGQGQDAVDHHSAQIGDGPLAQPAHQIVSNPHKNCVSGENHQNEDDHVVERPHVALAHSIVDGVLGCLRINE